jgi:hypothetical protein
VEVHTVFFSGNPGDFSTTSRRLMCCGSYILAKTMNLIAKSNAFCLLNVLKNNEFGSKNDAF